MRRIRIATWNIKTQFAHPSGAEVTERPEWRIKSLCEALERLDADIVAIQEIESLAALAAINRRLRRPYRQIEVLEGNSTRCQHQGFLSRFDFRCSSHCGLCVGVEGRDLRLVGSALSCVDRTVDDGGLGDASRPRIFRRDALLAEVEVSRALAISLFNLHLKSQRDAGEESGAAASLRAAEAGAVAHLVREHETLRPAAPIVILGDFNAPPDDSSLRALARLGYDDVVRRDWVAPGRHPRFTFAGRHRSRVDVVLLSPLARRHYASDTARIHRNLRTRKASDHFPVSADLHFS